MYKGISRLVSYPSTPSILLNRENIFAFVYKLVQHSLWYFNLDIK